MRNWVNPSILASAKSSPINGKFGICPLPKGQAGMVGTLGRGWFSGFRYSLYPREAAMLVRFLCGRNEQLRRSENPAEPSTIPELYGNPTALAANRYFPTVLEVYRKGLAVRPSILTGKMYPDISHAYFETVHAVLTHRKTAETAAADLQRELTQITGFKAPVAALKGRGFHETAGKEPQER